MGKNILYVSGGEYGDIYGASLAANLKEIIPEITVKCVGAERIAGAGGAYEATPESELESGKVDCVVFADWPFFDIHLARKAKEKGVPVLYYAGACDRPFKARKLRKSASLVDRVLATYPFEVPLYREAGIDVEFTGHPLVDIVGSSIGKDEAKAALGYERTEVPVALVPGGNGDREGEMLRLMVEGAAEAAAVSILKVRLVIPDAERYDEGFLNDMINISPRRIRVLKGSRQAALMASEAAVVSAGTATIEAALAGAPVLTLKKSSPLSYFLSSLGVGGSVFSGLPNTVLGRPLFPELVQKDVTPEKITVELGGILESATKEEFDRGIFDLRDALGPPGTIRRAAEAVLRVIGS